MDEKWVEDQIRRLSALPADIPLNISSGGAATASSSAPGAAPSSVAGADAEASGPLVPEEEGEGEEGEEGEEEEKGVQAEPAVGGIEASNRATEKTALDRISEAFSACKWSNSAGFERLREESVVTEQGAGEQTQPDGNENRVLACCVAGTRCFSHALYLCVARASRCLGSCAGRILEHECCGSAEAKLNGWYRTARDTFCNH